MIEKKTAKKDLQVGRRKAQRNGSRDEESTLQSLRNENVDSWPAGRSHGGRHEKGKEVWWKTNRVGGSFKEKHNGVQQEQTKNKGERKETQRKL